MEPEAEPPLLPGAGGGVDPSRSEPESAPGPGPSGAGAAQKSGGSAILLFPGAGAAPKQAGSETLYVSVRILKPSCFKEAPSLGFFSLQFITHHQFSRQKSAKNLLSV